MFERFFGNNKDAGGAPDVDKKPQYSRDAFDDAERLQGEAWEREHVAKNGQAFLSAVAEKDQMDQKVTQLKKAAEDEARRLEEKYKKLKMSGASSDEIHAFEKEKLGMHQEP